ANFINNEKEIDWYKIRSKAQEIWSNICRLHPELSVDDIKINMGWISRFMSRNDMKIPKIAPPIIATANSINGHNGSITMVRKESPLDLAISTLPSTSSLWHPPLLSNGHSPPCSSSPSPTLSASSRRKCAVPKRAVDATLVINRPAAAAFLQQGLANGENGNGHANGTAATVETGGRDADDNLSSSDGIIEVC
uniref:HTH CENPB-type domain-containing protein n=1 Tax=Acrobeloides nanus TaxID=290746 RepID=A0A914DYV4_9BILA